MPSHSSTQSPALEVKESSTSATELGVDLTVRLVRHVDRLEVRYRVDNRRRDEIYVMNQIPSKAVDGALEYRPDDVYVDIAGETLQLTKGALPVRWTFPAVYDYPDARMVASGASLTETFVVPVPAKVRTRYTRRKGRGETRAAKRAIAREVIVGIGIVPSGVGCTFSRERPEYPDVVTVAGDIAEPEGGLLLMGQTMLSVRFELEEELPVLDYESFPWP